MGGPIAVVAEMAKVVIDPASNKKPNIHQFEFPILATYRPVRSGLVFDFTR